MTAPRGDSGQADGRVFQPGDVVDGLVLSEGDCPFNDTDPADLIADDGGDEGSLYCGFGDDRAVCVARAAYTAWLCGVPGWDPEHPELGTPVALCPGHAEVVRGWVYLLRMHTVRAPGTCASWAWGQERAA